MQYVTSIPGEGGGGGAWVNFCWVYAAGLSEPLPHYNLFCGHIIGSTIVTFGKKAIFASQLSHFLFMYAF